jgi:hypothetical protein
MEEATTLTAKLGGTEASFPVVLESVDNGMIVFAFLAGGCLLEDA